MKCPTCGSDNDKHHEMNGRNVQPREGDVICCFYCFTLGQIKAGELVPFDITRLHPDQRAFIERLLAEKVKNSKNVA